MGELVKYYLICIVQENKGKEIVPRNKMDGSRNSSDTWSKSNCVGWIADDQSKDLYRNDK